MDIRTSGMVQKVVIHHETHIMKNQDGAVQLNTGVYAIINSVNGKRYIGSSAKSLKKRWQHHITTLRDGCHHNRHLQRAWNKYGESQFEFVIIERCMPDDCLTREQAWMDFYYSADRECGYNLRPTASNNRGYTQDPEVMLDRIGRDRVQAIFDRHRAGDCRYGIKPLAREFGIAANTMRKLVHWLNKNPGWFSKQDTKIDLSFATPRGLVPDGIVKAVLSRYQPYDPNNGSMALALEFGIAQSTVMNIVQYGYENQHLPAPPDISVIRKTHTAKMSEVRREKLGPDHLDREKAREMVAIKIKNIEIRIRREVPPEVIEAIHQRCRLGDRQNGAKTLAKEFSLTVYRVRAILSWRTEDRHLPPCESYMPTAKHRARLSKSAKAARKRRKAATNQSPETINGE